MDELFSNNTSSVVSSNRILYTPSSFAKSSLLHLQEIGELEARRSHTSSRSKLQSYLFFMVTGGSGSLLYDAKSYALSSGACVFIDCQAPYSHTPDPEDLWSLRWVHFYGPTLPAIYDKYKERGGRPVFRPESKEEIGRLWKELMQVAGSSDYMRDMRINALLGELMVCIMAESWHPEDQVTAKKKASVLEVKEYLDRNYGEKISLDSLADRFYINKYYLSKSFKEQFGQPLSAYILSVRITKAKQLLRFSDKNIEEIGYECGLGAPHYFSQTFKAVEGVPPSQYRKQWSNVVLSPGE